ncbi:phage head closure protein [Paraburkholderia madseniana]|uniref:phage head closure protein n=1 Tax=Paraburkholderia madseniana TaxID=2599607 RepID=UPI0015C53D0E|nr:phage head closure protein [Paraburkholderia madseniana]NPT63603.1 phage head closure protein [Paraburkholderia madseniana]
MRAGKLDRRIVIQRRQNGKNSSGGARATWQTVCTPWAGINYLSGTERSATTHQGGETADARTLITMRYRAGIDETMRVLYGGKAFNIRFVNDVLDQHKTLILTCDTGASEGL